MIPFKTDKGVSGASRYLRPKARLTGLFDYMSHFQDGQAVQV